MLTLLAWCPAPIHAQAAPPPAAPAATRTPSASGSGETVALDLQRDESGLVVRLQAFDGLIRSLFDDASVSWDATRGAMIVEQGNRRIEALSAQPRVLVDGAPRPTTRPMVERGGRVLVPVETVELVLQELGVEFELSSAGALPRITPTPSSTPTSTPLTPTAAAPPVGTPALPGGLGSTPGSIPTPAPVATATPAAATADQLAAAPAPPTAATTPAPLVTPVPRQGGTAPAGDPSITLSDGSQGLSWRVLADAAHSNPRRIVLLHDARLTALADALAETFAARGLDCERISREDPAREPLLVTATLRDRQPDLVLYLLADPALATAESGAAPVLLLAAHEALWPLDRRNEEARDAAPTGAAPAGSGSVSGEAALPPRYLPQQFHSLALGGQLEKALAAADPPVAAQLQLAPLGLLRLTEQPAVALVIGTGSAPAGLAAGVAQGFADYVQRMQFSY